MHAWGDDGDVESSWGGGQSLLLTLARSITAVMGAGLETRRRHWTSARHACYYQMENVVSVS